MKVGNLLEILRWKLLCVPDCSTLCEAKVFLLVRTKYWRKNFTITEKHASPKTKAVRFRVRSRPHFHFMNFFFLKAETWHRWSPRAKYFIFEKHFAARRLHAPRAHFFQSSFSKKCYFWKNDSFLINYRVRAGWHAAQIFYSRAPTLIKSAPKKFRHARYIACAPTPYSVITISDPKNLTTPKKYLNWWWSKNLKFQFLFWLWTPTFFWR